MKYLLNILSFSSRALLNAGVQYDENCHYNIDYVSAAEVDEQDTHQIIVIGVVAVVPHNVLADCLMDDISLFVEENTEAKISCNSDFRTEYAYLPEPVFKELGSFMHLPPMKSMRLHWGFSALKRRKGRLMFIYYLKR